MKSLELFVGAGGLGMGVAAAGFSHQLIVENDKRACATIQHNKQRGVSAVKDWPDALPVDVTSIDFREYEASIDLISGGPPCQPFSLGGKHQGQLDKRDMFPAAIRAVREARPKAVLIENVRGLLRETFASYFEYITLQLRYPSIQVKAGETWTDHLARLEQHSTSKEGGSHPEYSVVFRSLNAADFGVPQRRERVFIVALRSDLDLAWNFPSATHSHEALLNLQILTDAYWERHEIPKEDRPPIQAEVKQRLEKQQQTFDFTNLLPWRTVRDAISDLPEPKEDCDQGFHNHILIPGARSYAGHTGSSLDTPAKTLKAGSHGVPGGENTLVLGSTSVRYFTVREAARLQSFSDDYIFEGAWTTIMRQLGNAVPVKMAELLACSLFGVLAADPEITTR